MRPRPLLVRALLCSCLACCAWAQQAHAAAWHPVPGTQEVEIDLASIRQTGTRVAAWLRWPGTPAHVLSAAAGPRTAGQPRVTRTAVLTEFDCASRGMRVLAANSYDAGDVPVAMSSIPGPALPVRGSDTEWAYDAACEAARAGARF